jgi:bifunctional DNase/RNase
VSIKPKARTKKTLRKRVKLRTTKTASQSDWIELTPYGITVHSPNARPILLLKNDDETETLPVWLSPVSAGMALADLSKGEVAGDPLAVTRKVMRAFGAELVRCDINELIGHHQYAELHFTGNPMLSRLRVRAEDAAAFTLGLGAPFFSTKEHMMQCRQIDAQLGEFEKAVSLNPEIGSKKHLFMM